MSGVECIPFKTAGGGGGGDGGGDSGGGGGGGGGSGGVEVVQGERWETGCVKDPASWLYRQCAVEVNQRSRPKRTAYCAEPAQNMEVTKFSIGLNFLFFNVMRGDVQTPEGGGGCCVYPRR